MLSLPHLAHGATERRKENRANHTVGSIVAVVALRAAHFAEHLSRQSLSVSIPFGRIATPPRVGRGRRAIVAANQLAVTPDADAGIGRRAACGGYDAHPPERDRRPKVAAIAVSHAEIGNRWNVSPTARSIP